MTPQSIERLYVNRSPVIMFSISLLLFRRLVALLSAKIIQTHFNTQTHTAPAAAPYP